MKHYVGGDINPYDQWGGTILELRVGERRVEIDESFGKTIVIELADQGYVDSEYLSVVVQETEKVKNDPCGLAFPDIP